MRDKKGELPWLAEEVTCTKTTISVAGLYVQGRLLFYLEWLCKRDAVVGFSQGVKLKIILFSLKYLL